MKRRSRETIAELILTLCLEGINKTRIVYQANLNFKTVRPYLDLLIENGLIEVEEGKGIVKAIYRTTQKGEELLDQLKVPESISD